MFQDTSATHIIRTPDQMYELLDLLNGVGIEATWNLQPQAKNPNSPDSVFCTIFVPATDEVREAIKRIKGPKRDYRYATLPAEVTSLRLITDESVRELVQTIKSSPERRRSKMLRLSQWRRRSIRHAR